MSYSVVILSKDGAKAAQCVDAALRMQPGLDPSRVILVDDGMEPMCGLSGLVVQGAKPFIFARNANIGIRFAAPNDVILLNDDALLETPGGFERLKQAAAEDQGYGLMAAVTDSVSNPRQMGKPLSWSSEWQKTEIIHEPRMVCFICVYIPRRTIDLIGGLDERFDGYGWEDNAYCELVKRAGLKIGIYTGCFVNHTKLKSSFRDGTYPAGGFERGKAIFEKYYGGHT